MRTILKTAPVVCAMLLAGCAKQDAVPVAEAPHATVVMRDGRRLSGAVTASTPSAITLNVDGGAQQTFAMKDVRRVDYGDAVAAAPVPGPGAAVPPVSMAPPVEPTHEDHRHAEPAEI